VKEIKEFFIKIKVKNNNGQIEKLSKCQFVEIE